jgi:sodium pump decarboxylase gamma subunit
MTINEMLIQSGILTVLGMGVVFLFLLILIGFMNFTSSVIVAWNKKHSEENQNAK